LVPPHERAMTVAVRAYDIAFRDFLEDSAVGSTSRHVRYECVLHPGIPMIELHHESREAIPAVKARYTAQPPEQLDLTETDRRLGG